MMIVLLKQELERFVVRRDVTLSSGHKSKYYFDIKKASLNSVVLNLMSRELLGLAKDICPEMKGVYLTGMELGAVPLIAGMLAKANHNIEGCIVRKETKTYGTENKIENMPSFGSKVIIVDDVITTGASVRLITDHMLNSGYHVEGIISVITRSEKSRKQLENEYDIPVLSLFRKEDFYNDVV